MGFGVCVKCEYLFGGNIAKARRVKNISLVVVSVDYVNTFESQFV